MAVRSVRRRGVLSGGLELWARGLEADSLPAGVQGRWGDVL